MPNPFTRRVRRAPLLFAVALTCAGAQTTAASAAEIVGAPVSGPGYAGTCTVSAKLNLVGTSVQPLGKVTCDKRQGYTWLRVMLKRDTVNFAWTETGEWQNSFGLGDTWFTFAPVTACARGYAPKWQAVVTAFIYDYYHRQVNQITATTSTPKVLCNV